MLGASVSEVTQDGIVRSREVARSRNVAGVWNGRGLHVTRREMLQIRTAVPSTQVIEKSYCSKGVDFRSELVQPPKAVPLRFMDVKEIGLLSIPLSAAPDNQNN